MNGNRLRQRFLGLASGALIMLGASAYGDSAANHETFTILGDAVDLGVIDNSGEVGFLLRGKAELNADEVNCSDNSSRNVKILSNTQLEVVCTVHDTYSVEVK